jgi:hypothetical protein
MADKIGRFKLGDEPQSKSPKKRRRDTLGITALKAMFVSSPSPSKESRQKSEKNHPYSSKVEKRVMRRRARTQKDALERGYDSDDMTEQQIAHRQQPGAQPQSGFVAQAGGFFSWVEQHPHLPTVLTYWIQLGLNLCFAFSLLYAIYFIYSAVMADVNIEASKYQAEALRTITLCAKEYRDNECHRPLPALTTACGTWKACMDQDPQKVAKASVTARTFARIVNAFVHEFSYKSMVCIIFLLIGTANVMTLWSRWYHPYHVQHYAHHPNFDQRYAQRPAPNTARAVFRFVANKFGREKRELPQQDQPLAIEGPPS